MLSRIITLIAFLTSSLVLAGDDAWHLDYLYTLVNERLDPVMQPNMQGTHMHKVLGGSGFSAAYDGATYASATCSSARCQADKSNYWMPSLYWVDKSTGNYVPLPAGPRFYYFLGRNAPSQRVQPFPEGLRMIAGDPNNKAGTQASSFTCQRLQDQSNNLFSDNFNFNSTCAYGLKTELFFPPCWDGLNLYLSDNSHMSYPINGNVRDGSCPLSHPIRLPAILLEYTWYTNQYDPVTPLAGNLIWANGDTTGFGIHGDFVNGWDIDVLGAALNSTACGIGGGNAIAMEQCPILNAYFSDSAAKACKPMKGVLQEPTGNTDLVPISALPGCNLPWGATGSKPTCNPGVKALDVSAFTGKDGPLVTSNPQNTVIPTTPGWATLTCINEQYSLGNSSSYFDPNMSQTSCQTTCHNSGYVFAATGLRGSGGWQCVCSNDLDMSAPILPGSCIMACPGNSSQTCGGNYIYQVSHAPLGTTIDQTTITTANNATYMGCYNQATPAGGTYTFQSNAMTRVVCNSACQAKNAVWASTTGGRQCTCGTTWSQDSLFVPDSFCAYTCTGNSSQFCGDHYTSSVYNLTMAKYATNGPGHLDGYLGCYNQGSNYLGLSSSSWGSSSMTQASCVNGCSELGYGLAGLRQGNQCFCGNTWTGGQDLPASQCSTACAGNSTQVCGASGNMDVYNTTGYTTPATLGVGRPGKYLGCYVDTAGTFGNYSYTASSMTIQACTTACAGFGYDFAGIKGGNTCTCGAAGPTTRQAISSTSCTKTCYGNSTQPCGGSGYFDAYDVTTLEVTKDIDSAHYMGCYGDSPTGLGAYYYSQSAMTVSQCRTSCSELGYSVSGVNGGTLCRCGNSWAGGQVLPDAQCTSKCPGNSTQTCGGTNIISLWQTAGAKALPPKPAGWQGCFSDSASTRILSNYSYSSSMMSSDLCKTACAKQNYAMAATEYTNQCFCGNTPLATSKRIPSVLCTSLCTGNSSETCGASYMADLYTTGATASVPALSANSTSSANSTTATGAAKPSSTASGGSGVVTTSQISCYSDDSAINSISFTADYMSPTVCGNWCFAKGFAFGGVRNGNICKCGNTSPKAYVPLTSCQSTAVCTADGSAYCGTSTTIAVFSTVNQGFASTGFPYVADSTGLVGCFQEVSSRILQGASFSTNSMTNTLCVQNCQDLGYTYAGSTAGNQCYCGNTLNNTGNGYKVQTADCTSKCPGGTDFCGASGKSSIYDISKTPNNAITEGSGHQGCFAPGTFVTNALFNYTIPGMIPDLCRQTCNVQGVKYAALFNGATCVCSDNNDFGARLAPNTCSRACSGDATTMCGGYTGVAMDVYDTTSPGATVDKTGFASNYMGCFVDQTPRTLPAMNYVNSGMTNDMCQRVCSASGYKVAGTQSGNGCYCGSTMPLAGLAPVSGCSTACSGVKTTNCGGSWRLSIYSNLPVAAGSNSSVSSSVPIVATNTSISVSASTSKAANATLASSSANVASGSKSATTAPITAGNTVVSSSKASAITAPVTSTSKAAVSITAPVTSTSKAAVSSSKAADPITSPVTSTSKAVVITAPVTTTSTSKAVVITAPVTSTSEAAGTGGATSKVGDPVSTVVTDSVTSTSVTPVTEPVTSASASKASSLASSVASSLASSVAASSVSKAATESITTSKAASITAPTTSASVSAPKSSALGSGVLIATQPITAATTTTSKASSSSSSTAAAASSTTVVASAATSSSAKASTTSTQAAVPSVASGQLVGCYTQSSTAPSIHRANMTVVSLIPSMCNLWCNANGYTYAGVANGNYCACGNDISGMTSVASSQCAVSCSGDSGVKCGGATALSVYRSSTVVMDWKRDESAENIRAWHGERGSGAGGRRNRGGRMKGLY